MKQLIALCLYAILFESCSNSTEDDNIIRDELFPLKVGNYWIYENKDYALSNKDSLIKYYLDTIMVESKSVEGSKTLYKLKNDFTYSTESDGTWIYFINGNVIMDKSLLLKYPTKVGDLINIKPLNMQNRTLSTSENVKIDLGEYTCYKYNFSNQYSNTLDYFAPKIGLIKSINTYYSNELKDSVISYQTLISFHLE